MDRAVKAGTPNMGGSVISVPTHEALSLVKEGLLRMPEMSVCDRIEFLLDNFTISDGSF